MMIIIIIIIIIIIFFNIYFIHLNPRVLSQHQQLRNEINSHHRHGHFKAVVIGTLLRQITMSILRHPILILSRGIGISQGLYISDKT
jgi:hypothetical protein